MTECASTSVLSLTPIRRASYTTMNGLIGKTSQILCRITTAKEVFFAAAWQEEITYFPCHLAFIIFKVLHQSNRFC